MRLTVLDLTRLLPCGAAAIVFVAFAHPVASQHATLVGVVRDTAGSPIEAGEILGLTSRRLSAVSARGRFVLGALPDGPEVFLIRAIGFRPERLAVTLAPGDTLEIDVVLQRIAQMLAEVTVEVRGKLFTGRLAEIASRR